MKYPIYVMYLTCHWNQTHDIWLEVLHFALWNGWNNKIRRYLLYEIHLSLFLNPYRKRMLTKPGLASLKTSLGLFGLKNNYCFLNVSLILNAVKLNSASLFYKKNFCQNLLIQGLRRPPEISWILDADFRYAFFYRHSYFCDTLKKVR